MGIDEKGVKEIGWLGWQLRNEKGGYIAWRLMSGGVGGGQERYGLVGLVIIMK